MTEDAVSARAASAGEMLRAAREQRGMHLGVLAASIKVPPRKLEALEADRYDELPDASFTRALALAVCRALKIDAEPVLAQLPQPTVNQGLERVASGLNTPFRDRPGRLEPDDRPWLRRPVFWATALVLLAAAVLALLPDELWQRLDPRIEPSVDPAVVPLPVEPASAPATTAIVPDPAAPAVSESVPAEPAVAGMSAPSAADAPVPGADVTEPAPAQRPAAAEPVPAARAPAVAVLRTRAESWVEVQDATGRTLLSRVLQPGETVRVDGALPLRAKIGNAPETDLVFRDRPVDLAPVTGRDNVARLELK